MTMAAIRQRLAEGGAVLLDGATGTELERRGAAMSHGAWCALATETAPGLLRAIHEDYIRAGADIVVANTFSNARHMLEMAGVGDKAAALTRRAVAIAHEARANAGADRPVVVAASLSHQMPMVAGAARDDPALRPPPERVRANLREVAMAAAAAGAELLILEMMSRPLHIAAAIAAAEDSGLPYWCGLSARLQGSEVLSFVWEGYPFRESVAAALKGRPEAVGVMHTPVAAMAPALEVLKRSWQGPTMAYPDSGFFQMPRWRFEDVVAPADLAGHARAWRRQGVQVFGGCCGLGPDHVRALAPLRRA